MSSLNLTRPPMRRKPVGLWRPNRSSAQMRHLHPSSRPNTITSPTTVLALKHIANLAAIIDRIEEDYRDGRLFDGLTEGEREDIEAVEKFTGRLHEDEQTTNPENRNVSDLSTPQLRNIIDQIRQILWFDFATNEFDPDKEWEVDTIEYVAGVLEDHGLRPREKRRRMKVVITINCTGSGGSMGRTAETNLLAFCDRFALEFQSKSTIAKRYGANPNRLRDSRGKTVGKVVLRMTKVTD